MNTIVMNTLNRAVTEYSGFDFQSITARYAGSAVALWELNGQTDHGQPIVAVLDTGTRLWGTPLKKTPSALYLSLRQPGDGMQVTVGGSTGAKYSYALSSHGGGPVSRAILGRGMRENYLSFGVTNPTGNDFCLDVLEVALQSSKIRRIG